MTLNEGIEYCEKVAEDKERIAKCCKDTKCWSPYPNEYMQNEFENGAKKWRQFAEWLKELKTYRNNKEREEVKRNDCNNN